MVANEKSYSKLLPANSDCLRPIGGHCVGNCRKTAGNAECLRPIGGHCVGNCRKTNGKKAIEW